MDDMTPFGSLGRLLILMGVLLVVVGVLLTFAPRMPRLPGDIIVQKPTWTIYVPIGTMIVVSVLLTLLLNLVFRR